MLGHLLKDGRATFRAVGDLVGLSAPAVKRRVEWRRARGDMAGFTATIDPAALGRDTEANVELSYRGNVTPAQLTRDLSATPELVGATTITGNADALVHILAASLREMRRPWSAYVRSRMWTPRAPSSRCRDSSSGPRQ